MPTIQLSKSAIDLGIVAESAEPMLHFYRDTLGLELEATLPMPGGTTMYRLTCGETVLKILIHEQTPTTSAAPGGPRGASGIRYFTLSVSNLSEMTETCREAGYAVPLGPLEIRPGVNIVMIEDPEGNWLELLESQ
jgi:catechol 2,3-dioxygenase-like lactoylglutathione lyase family enzyme